MSDGNKTKHDPATAETDDGGLEKALHDYHKAGGGDADTDAVKILEGKIAKANAQHEERLKTGRPQQSRTSHR